MNSWNNSLNNSFASMQQLYTQSAKNIVTIKNTTDDILKKIKDLHSIFKIELKNLITAIGNQNRNGSFAKFNVYLGFFVNILASLISVLTKKPCTQNLSVTVKYSTINEINIVNKNKSNRNEKSGFEKLSDWVSLFADIIDIGGFLLKFIKRPQKAKMNPRNWWPQIKKLSSNVAKSAQGATSKVGSLLTKGTNSKVGSFLIKGASKVGNSLAKGAPKVGNLLAKGASKVGNLLTKGTTNKVTMKAVAKAAPKLLMRALPWVARGAFKFVPLVGWASAAYDAYSIYKYLSNKKTKNAFAKTNKNPLANAKNYDPETQFSNVNTMNKSYPSISNNKNQATKKKKPECIQTGFRNFTIAKIADTVVIREEADINRIAKAIMAKIEGAQKNKGGRVKNIGNLAQA